MRDSSAIAKTTVSITHGVEMDWREKRLSRNDAVKINPARQPINTQFQEVFLGLHNLKRIRKPTIERR